MDAIVGRDVRSNFAFPKWYTEYLRTSSSVTVAASHPRRCSLSTTTGAAAAGAAVGGTAEANAEAKLPQLRRHRQRYRLAFLQQDGDERRPTEQGGARSEHGQLPAKRLHHHQQLHQHHHQQFPALRVLPPSAAILQPPKQAQAQPTHRHPALYSGIRVLGGGGPHYPNKAGTTTTTIPSMVSIRQNFRLPPLMVKKLS